MILLLEYDCVLSKIDVIFGWQVMTYHLALHCLADLRCSKDAILDHWFLPYFITAALRISSFGNKKDLVCKLENDAEFKNASFQRKEAMEPVSFEQFRVRYQL